MAIVKGDSVIFYLDGVAVKLQMDITLNYTADMLETTNKDNAGAKTYLPGDTGWTMSGGQRLDWSDTPNASEVFAAISAGTQVAVDMGQITTGKVYGGNGYFSSFTIDGARNDIGNVSFEVQGDGALAEGTTT